MAKRRLSSTIEDYLQSIYSLETEGERVISARLARWMRVSNTKCWPWLSSARVVRCWVKSRNERNPLPYLPAG